MGRTPCQVGSGDTETETVRPGSLPGRVHSLVDDRPITEGQHGFLCAGIRESPGAVKLVSLEGRKVRSERGFAEEAHKGSASLDCWESPQEGSTGSGGGVLKAEGRPSTGSGVSMQGTE